MRGYPMLSEGIIVLGIRIRPPLRLVLCEELLRLDKQSRAMVNAGQLSCSSKRMRRRFVVATGSPAASEFRRYCLRLTREALCVVLCLRPDDQQLVLRSEHPMRRHLDKLVRRRFEDQSMVCFVIDYSVWSTGCPAFVFSKQRLVVQLRDIVRYCSLQLVVITVVSDWIFLAWLEISSAVGSCVCWFGKLLVSTGFVAGRGFNPAGGAPGGG
ncbi:hypothetical protein F511_39131 [Dorcoceras hygrometricum]|uniref:Uncharacterized protein n=1 Tax=Dorcoceras hygrometricum TaxID=472368 RepID=A0A2Z7CFN5_9LAMI|nr:hypothetical protein F511_39131 [Dorcoceras hygrometricum]